jgi:hypothetical protein
VQTAGSPPFRHRLPDVRALWIAAAGAVLFARYPDWFLLPRLWAEDGPVFFLNAKICGPSVLAEPYAGYLNLIPRLIALAGSWLDPGDIPLFYCLSAFAVTLCVVARALSPRLCLAWRPALAMAIVAAPGTGEIYLCPTNIQWITAIALVMLVFTDDPDGIRAWAGDMAVLVLAGLTGPFSIFVAPFFVRRALVRRTAGAWIFAGIAAATAAVQGCEVALHPPPAAQVPPGCPLEWANLSAVLAARVPLSLLGGQGWILHVGRTVVIAAGGVCAACLVARVVRGGRHREICLVLLTLAAIVCAATAAKTRCDLWDYREMVNGDRYFYIPRVMLLWVAVGWLQAKSRAVAWSGTVLVAAATAFSCASHYIEGPGYRDVHIERKYFDWGRYCADLRAGDRVVITVSPGWEFTVPDRLDAR